MSGKLLTFAGRFERGGLRPKCSFRGKAFFDSSVKARPPGFLLEKS